jgi:hypothetical protein
MLKGRLEREDGATGKFEVLKPVVDALGVIFSGFGGSFCVRNGCEMGLVWTSGLLAARIWHGVRVSRS